MKKRLSIFLIFVLLFSLSSTTVASALPNKSELPGLYAAEDGDMFILQSEDRDATIITNDTHHSMTVSIKYSHNPDTVYQMNCYTCTAIFSRYVNVNSSEYPYNMTIRTVSYEAYEDASPSSTRRAEIDSGSRTTSYNKSESYYQNCYAQALDGYNVYKSVGPRS